ncbi:hypothetical protein Q1Z72_06980 [Pseudomonas qingdaonensis]|uniref:hypothetical protein n=1 Tax=Pseudomonas qingdaonensis TaxID=2056231 RepID=UPI00265F9684|nr:hypothetical protein [Pseudomonas qingdaonensis]WKL68401.1 hypothetical protein Q1Z72_06980 [Pseudomonas qingdaonensis]
MNSSAPKIGFDRFIPLEWVASVLSVRNGTMPFDGLYEQLKKSGLGKEALAKSLTKLNGLGLQPRDDLVDFVDRGLSAVPVGASSDEVAAYAWGVAVATYPFFGKVSELVGRLTLLQGDCSSVEIHRRMSEVYGDREITKRATQAVLQTQTNWGVVLREDKGKRLTRQAPRTVTMDELTVWLIEAAVRYAGKPVSVPSLQSLPVLYPFTLTRPLAYLVSNSAKLILRSEGPSSQFVVLREQA